MSVLLLYVTRLSNTFVFFTRMNLVEVVFNFVTLAMVCIKTSPDRHAIGLMFFASVHGRLRRHMIGVHFSSQKTIIFFVTLRIITLGLNVLVFFLAWGSCQPIRFEENNSKFRGKL